MISLRAKAEIIAGGLAILFAVFGFRIWIQEHDDRLRAEATSAAAKKAFDDAGAQIKAHQAADAARDEATAKQLEAMQAIAAKIQTPAQIAEWIPKQLPGLPQPITVTIPPATAQNPSPPAAFSVPQADLPTLRDNVAQCQQNAVRASNCELDRTSKAEQLRLAGEQLSAVERERDSWKAAAKGGTFWTRVKRGAKLFAIGAGVTAAGLCGSGHCK